MTSAVKTSPSRAATVRQQPLTEIESPRAASSTTTGPSHAEPDGVALVLQGDHGAELLDDAGEHSYSSLAVGRCGLNVSRTLRSAPCPTTVTSSTSNRTASAMVLIGSPSTAWVPSPTNIGAT